MNMNDTLAIKISATSIPAKACMALKRLTGLSVGDIQRKIANDEFLLICDYVDDDGLKLINGIKREMQKYGIATKQYEDGEEKPSALFDNIERLHEEINSQDDTDF